MPVVDDESFGPSEPRTNREVGRDEGAIAQPIAGASFVETQNQSTNSM
jgi:hypothetical protein